VTAVTQPLRLLAAGRDAEIYVLDDARVLRRANPARSLAHEARVMTYARSEGFPVPEVFEVRAGGTEVVMERIHGHDMVAELARKPWALSGLAATLAELHHRLHAIAAPQWLGPPRGNPKAARSDGDRLVHLDLHPLNVLMDGGRPVVIDWSNAAAGRPELDVALTWVLLACGGLPQGALRARLLGPGRDLLVRSFLSHFDRHEVASALGDAVAFKLADPHMSEAERAAMRRLARRVGGRTGR
jgi:aminoglycoside phosphotransferase (APT) family kinase protein